MTDQEFFWTVARMRGAQIDYFRERKISILRACKVLEREIDEEIERRKQELL